MKPGAGCLIIRARLVWAPSFKHVQSIDYSTKYVMHRLYTPGNNIVKQRSITSYHRNLDRHRKSSSAT